MLLGDPAADDEAAGRCHTAAGFTKSGVLHTDERDADGKGWHDALLMEFVTDDLVPAADR